jgi:hypothetical protein
MRLNSRKFGKLRIYSGPQAKRRAAGMSPDAVAWRSRQVRLHTDGCRQAVALLACCAATALVTAAVWFLCRGFGE